MAPLHHMAAVSPMRRPPGTPPHGFDKRPGNPRPIPSSKGPKPGTQTFRPGMYA